MTGMNTSVSTSTSSNSSSWWLFVNQNHLSTALRRAYSYAQQMDSGVPYESNLDHEVTKKSAECHNLPPDQIYQVRNLCDKIIHVSIQRVRLCKQPSEESNVPRNSTIGYLLQPLSLTLPQSLGDLPENYFDELFARIHKVMASTTTLLSSQSTIVSDEHPLRSVVYIPISSQSKPLPPSPVKPNRAQLEQHRPASAPPTTTTTYATSTCTQNFGS